MAAANYAARVLERLGLADLFDEVWDIRTMGFVPKPDRGRLSRRSSPRRGIAPGRAAMFDDIARNLVPARALGMTTVWLNNGSAWSQAGPGSIRSPTAPYRL